MYVYTLNDFDTWFLNPSSN